MGVTISDNLFRIHPKQQPTVQGFCHVGHCSKTSKTSLEHKSRAQTQNLFILSAPFYYTSSILFEHTFQNIPALSATARRPFCHNRYTSSLPRCHFGPRLTLTLFRFQIFQFFGPRRSLDGRDGRTSGDFGTFGTFGTSGSGCSQDAQDT